MLDWSAGPLKAADALSLPLNEGVSCLDEPPETPAHIFAYRAFKTALFGTPHPEVQPRVSSNPAISRDAAITPPQKHKSRTVGSSKAASAHADNQQTRDQVFAKLTSPAKGILLTPGIGASRRKNVSFMQTETDNFTGDIPKLRDDIITSQDGSPTRKSHLRDSRPRPTALTKTLLELSKQGPDARASSMKATPRVERVSPPPALSVARIQPMQEPAQVDPDHTVDLSKPHSRSGQHWKTEYDRYFERSNREMRQVIQYGQNVKSYAAKKDTEASRLVDQLQKEQARVEAMERKVVRLNKRLEVAQAEDKTGEGDHARLVASIAQQTALASKYRDECEALQDRLGRISHVDPSEHLPPRGEYHDQVEADDQMRQLREAAQNASEQAQRLEAENLALKRSLARVKQEMMSYESRRLAREDRLKQREQKHKAAKEAVQSELQRLQAEGRDRPDFQGKESAAIAADVEENGVLTVPNAMSNDPEAKLHRPPKAQPLKENDPSRRPSSSSISPRKRRSRPPVDIWTMESPLETGPRAHELSRSQTSGLPPSSVKQDIEKTLKEIDRNIVTGLRSTVTSNQTEFRLKTKEPIGYEDGQPIWPDTSTMFPEQVPDQVAMSSPAKLQASMEKVSSNEKLYFGATTGRSASMLSRGPGGRAASLSSSRSKLTMTEERRAATRARLAQKSAEKGRSSASR